MSKCTILVGVPACGKSTWLRRQHCFYTDGSIGMIALPSVHAEVCSTDDIVSDIAADHSMTYDEAYKDLIGFADKVFWNRIKRNFELGRPMFIDRTNLTVKGRKRFFDALPGYTFDAYVFPIPKKAEWERRLNSRPGKNIPQHILENMLKSYQIPTKEEGFENITFL